MIAWCRRSVTSLSKPVKTRFSDAIFCTRAILVNLWRTLMYNFMCPNSIVAKPRLMRGLRPRSFGSLVSESIRLNWKIRQPYVKHCYRFCFTETGISQLFCHRKFLLVKMMKKTFVRNMIYMLLARRVWISIAHGFALSSSGKNICKIIWSATLYGKLIYWSFPSPNGCCNGVVSKHGPL